MVTHSLVRAVERWRRRDKKRYRSSRNHTHALRTATPCTMSMRVLFVPPTHANRHRCAVQRTAAVLGRAAPEDGGEGAQADAGAREGRLTRLWRSYIVQSSHG